MQREASNVSSHQRVFPTNYHLFSSLYFHVFPVYFLYMSHKSMESHHFFIGKSTNSMAMQHLRRGVLERLRTLTRRIETDFLRFYPNEIHLNKKYSPLLGLYWYIHLYAYIYIYVYIYICVCIDSWVSSIDHSEPMAWPRDSSWGLLNLGCEPGSSTSQGIEVDIKGVSQSQ